ncbi:MAG: magnesium/cobalt transporter CorA [Dehalococcoidia bacterium]
MTMPTTAEEQEELGVESVAFQDVTWINIEKPSRRQMSYLERAFHFHPLDLDDCLSKVQLPKVDEYDDYLFIVLHFPVFLRRARVTHSTQVGIFIGKDYIVTVHAGNLRPLANLFQECQSDESARQENMGRSPSYLLYRLVDRMVDYCFPILNKIISNIEKVEDDIFDERALNTVQEISILRRDIIAFRRINWPLRAVIGSMERRVSRFSGKDEKEMDVYFGDVVDHLDKIWSALDEYKEIIEGLSDTNNSLTSNRINEVMRVLTIFATIMMPLTVVSSIYGMNVPLPGGLQSGSFISFIVVIIFMAMIGGSMLFYFHRKHWI